MGEPGTDVGVLALCDGGAVLPVPGMIRCVGGCCCVGLDGRSGGYVRTGGRSEGIPIVGRGVSGGSGWRGPIAGAPGGLVGLGFAGITGRAVITGREGAPGVVGEEEDGVVVAAGAPGVVGRASGTRKPTLTGGRRG